MGPGSLLAQGGRHAYLKVADAGYRLDVRGRIDELGFGARAGKLRLEAGSRFVICAELAGKTLLVAEAVTFLDKKEAGTTSKPEMPGLDAIVCEKAESFGTFTVPGTTGTSISNLVIKFSGKCENSLEPTKCTVEEPITTRPIKAANSLTATGEVDIVLTPATGTELWTETILNRGSETCSGKYTLKVAGSQLCEMNGEGLFEVTQLLFCKPEGSHLKGAGEEMTLELTEELWFDSGFEGDPWAIVEGK
jgi:hypothetical protein